MAPGGGLSKAGLGRAGRAACPSFDRFAPARISHHLTVEARKRRASTSLRLLAVLNVLSQYACARQAARASY